MRSLLSFVAPFAQATPSEEATEGVRSILETVGDSLPRLSVAVVIIAIGVGVSRAVRWALRRVLRRRQTESFAQVMSKVGGGLVLLVFVLGAATALFPSVKPVDVLAGLGFFSVAVGFAFQDILENTLSGILLLFRQPFEAHDQIEVEGHTGTVEAITIRETRLRTYDGQLLVIPNRDVYKNAIRVQTHYPQRRMAFVAGIAYDNDAVEATDVIVRALTTVAGVAADPGPEALIAELGTSTVDIEARFWCSPRQLEGRIVLDRAINAVKAALERADIEMPADIVALQATPSFKAALQDTGDVTPGGGLRAK